MPLPLDLSNCICSLSLQREVGTAWNPISQGKTAPLNVTMINILSKNDFYAVLNGVQIDAEVEKNHKFDFVSLKMIIADYFLFSCFFFYLIVLPSLCFCKETQYM